MGHLVLSTRLFDTVSASRWQDFESSPATKYKRAFGPKWNTRYKWNSLPVLGELRASFTVTLNGKICQGLSSTPELTGASTGNGTAARRIESDCRREP
jgi:hypothetical protein